VFPVVALQDAAAVAFAESYLSGDCCKTETRPSQAEDPLDLSFGEVGVPLAFAAGLPTSNLPVPDVLLLCTRSQVVYVATGSVVTDVAQPGRRFTLRQFPSDSVRTLRGTSDVRLSVAVLVEGSFPNMTRGEAWSHDGPLLVHFAPELLFDRSFHGASVQ